MSKSITDKSKQEVDEQIQALIEQRKLQQGALAKIKESVEKRRTVPRTDDDEKKK